MPSSVVKGDGSIEPPPSTWHTSGPVLRSTNWLVAEVAVANETHSAPSRACTV